MKTSTIFSDAALPLGRRRFAKVHGRFCAFRKAFVLKAGSSDGDPNFFLERRRVKNPLGKREPRAFGMAHATGLGGPVNRVRTYMNNPTHFNRRQIVGGLGATLAGATFLPTLTAQVTTPAAPQPAGELRDPKTKYPAPPFKGQSQPWPGLAGKMDPVPDHGEKSYRGSGRLAGRKALITGGDSGMGRAAAIAYAREGADVAINYHPDEEPDAKEVIALIKAEGRIGLALPGDIRDEAFCQKLVEDAVKGLGGLDILVSNAGRQQAHESILDISTEQFDWTMKTNIYAPFWIIKAALPHLKPGSTIIGTTSEQATDPTPDLYDYAQTKAATTNYVRSLAKQLAPKGIRVNGVAPGPIWTPLQVSGGASQEKLKKFGGQTPMKRPGQPVELASIYVQLAAEDASYATGQVYGSAGGAGMP
jgi:NAD(P)-dependent dehydrogenase (short-subunit alcohol dehydrogenase family)